MLKWGKNFSVERFAWVVKLTEKIFLESFLIQTNSLKQSVVCGVISMS